MTLFGDLPGELYAAIIEQVPDDDVQSTVLSLTRTLPSAPIPLQPIFRRIRIGVARQAIYLYRRLRQKGEEDPARTWVQTLSIHAWTVDANVVLNVINLLTNLESLDIWIGPENFAPEHLEELFEKPFPNLRYLSLRFRPYVQKANYYQFLKGAYFDSDPIDSTMAFANRQSFAQPLVFFKIDPIMSILLRSPAMAEPLTAFRLRIPGRPAVRSLCLPAAASQSNSDGQPLQVAAIEILDLSTCNVLEGEVDMILAQFQTLQHLILDDCPVLRGELREGEWNAMGKRCALVGYWEHLSSYRKREEYEEDDGDWQQQLSRFEHLHPLALRIPVLPELPGQQYQKLASCHVCHP
ncbi:hypothetical protein EST38_g3191 [Candolleomyces aberdarensis]|uniref:F-box domain-containing protein n=1 Tax=Candolleomyces aberdarensis TaxID=2316362 RepID=A0A4Q2DUV0_9AGAR|nr:hypothetical protein EST38_g3191 [Candolleomyces aberdarensis]